MCKGYILIPRRIYEERQWNVRRVYSALDAFYDIYASANAFDIIAPDGTEIKKNQFLTSFRTLSDKWLWNQMKVKRFIDSLEKKGYLRLFHNTRKTIIEVVDFGVDKSDKNVTPVTPSVTPMLQDNADKHYTSIGVSVTPPVTPSVTQGATSSRANKNDNINKSSLSKEEKNKRTPLSPLKVESQFDWSGCPDDLVPLVEEWLDYKKEKKQPYKSPKGFKTLINRIIKLSGGDADIARQIIEQSMCNNYSGLFPLKYEYGKNNGNEKRRGTEVTATTPEDFIGAF